MIHDGLARLLLDRGSVTEERREIALAQKTLSGAPPSEDEGRRLAWQIAITSGVVADRAGKSSIARREWNSVVDSLWPSRDSLRDVRELTLLARALLHLGRVDDAAPLMDRILKTGYRGWLKNTAQDPCFQLWKEIVPSVVSAVKSGAMSPRCRLMMIPFVRSDGGRTALHMYGQLFQRLRYLDYSAVGAGGGSGMMPCSISTSVAWRAVSIAVRAAAIRSSCERSIAARP